MKINTLGISNRSADCYINSIMQCILSTEEFVRYIINNKETIIQYKIGNIIYDIIQECISLNNNVIDCLNLKLYVYKLDTKYKVGRQNDSQEFLLLLLNELHLKFINPHIYNIKIQDKQELLYVTLLNNIKENKQKIIKFKNDNYIDYTFYEFKKYKKYMYKKNYSYMNNIFMSTIISELQCIECNNINVNFYPEFVLSIEIDNKLNTLEESLMAYVKKEYLEDLIECSMCEKKTKHTKKLNIYKLSNNIIINFKKFDNYNNKKISDIYCPEILKLDKYINKSLINKNTIYQLYAMNYHNGNVNGGHYYSKCKNFSDHKWYICNDSSVQLDNFYDIENSIVKTSAYLLFYKKI